MNTELADQTGQVCQNSTNRAFSLASARAVFTSVLSLLTIAAADDSFCGEWGKRAYLMERSVFGLPGSPTQRYRSRTYSMICLPADSAVAREVGGSAKR